MDASAAGRRPVSPPENPEILPKDTFDGGRFKPATAVSDESPEILEKIQQLRGRISEGLNQLTGQIQGLRKLEEKEKNVYLALITHLEVAPLLLQYSQFM